MTHEDNEEEGLYAEPGWEDWEIHEPPKKPAWDDWEIHNLMPEDPSPAPPTTPKKPRRCGIRRRCHRPNLLIQVRMTQPQPDQVWRKVLLIGLLTIVKFKI